MLLLSAVENGQDELKKLKTDHVNILQILTMKLSSINLYILKRCFFHNVANVVNKVIPTH